MNANRPLSVRRERNESVTNRHQLKLQQKEGNNL